MSSFAKKRTSVPNPADRRCTGSGAAGSDVLDQDRAPGSSIRLPELIPVRRIPLREHKGVPERREMPRRVSDARRIEATDEHRAGVGAAACARGQARARRPPRTGRAPSLPWCSPRPSLRRRRRRRGRGGKCRAPASATTAKRPGQTARRKIRPLYSLGGPVAQLVEQGTFNPKVAGSNPARPILSNPLFKPNPRPALAHAGAGKAEGATWSLLTTSTFRACAGKGGTRRRRRRAPGNVAHSKTRGPWSNPERATSQERARLS